MTTGLIVYARLKSTRLARKVLKPIDGKPMIGHLIDRLRQSTHADKMVLCTSTVAEDDDLVRFAQSYDVPVFRGDPEDVLMRLRDAAEHFRLEDILCVTGDNPFADPVQLDTLGEAAAAGNADYATTLNLPLGVAGYYVRAGALARACAIKDTSDTEFWPEYFTETGIFRVIEARPVDPTLARPELRLTVDYPDDFVVAETLINTLGNDADLKTIVEYLDANPDLRAKNADAKQAPRPSPVLKPRGEWEDLLSKVDEAAA